MKARMSLISRDESGKILVLALVLLVLGALLLTPLLGLMNTGLIAGQTYEKKMAELYAADAGVEDAIWQMPQLHSEPDAYFPYSYPNTEDAWVVNDKSVNVLVDREQIGETACHRLFTYHIRATATSADGGSTTIDAYLISTPVFRDYSSITDHILVTKEGDLDEIKKKVTLEHGEENGPYPRWDGPWPTATEIEMFYWDDVVEDAIHYYVNTQLDAEGVNDVIGPLYVDGELDIRNSDNTAATLTLTGTLYITQDTSIGTGGKKNLTLDLNGHTIFVASPSVGNGNEALQISDRVTIKGPGAIIAIGDVYFAPNGDVGDIEEPVFIMSVSGTTRIRPGITIHGAVAGHFDVTIQSGSDPILVYPDDGFPDDLNFPGFVRYSEGEPVYSIASWEIT